MKECLLSEEVQEEIGRGLGLVRDTAAARDVSSLLLNCCVNNEKHFIKNHRLRGSAALL